MERECGRWIRTNSREVLDQPEALRFVVVQKSDNIVQRDSKVSTHTYYQIYIEADFGVVRFAMGTGYSCHSGDLLRATLWQ